MTQAVAAPSIADRIRAILKPRQFSFAERPSFSPCQIMRLNELADRGENLLVTGAMDSDREFVCSAERSVVEPLRAFYRAQAGKRRPLDENRLNNALMEIDSAIGSLSERLIKRDDAELMFEEGLMSLRAAAEDRKIHLNPRL